MARKSKRNHRPKSRLKKRSDADVRGSPAVCSKSYIITENPLAHTSTTHNEEELCGLRNQTRADFRTPEKRLHTPLPRICAGTSLGFSPPQPNDESRHFLPEIKQSNNYTHRSIDTERDEDPFSGLHNVRCIKQTRSGITFTQMFTPLPRIHSDGVIERRTQARAVNMASYLASRQLEQSRSGEKFLEHLRTTTEQSRQQREKKNRLRRQIQELEKRDSRVGIPRDVPNDVTERVLHVKEEQNRIRQQDYIRNMDALMGNKRRRK